MVNVTEDGYVVLNEAGTYVDVTTVASMLGTDRGTVMKALGDVDVDYLMDFLVDRATSEVAAVVRQEIEGRQAGGEAKDDGMQFGREEQGQPEEEL